MEWFKIFEQLPEPSKTLIIHFVSGSGELYEDYGHIFARSEDAGTVFNNDEDNPFHIKQDCIKKWCYSPFH